MMRGIRVLCVLGLMLMPIAVEAQGTAKKPAPAKKAAAPAKKSARTAKATGPAKASATPAASARPAGPRRLEDIQIEGEVPVPQVLFITARDQRRFLESHHNAYLRTSRELGEATPLPVRVILTPTASAPAPVAAPTPAPVPTPAPTPAPAENRR
jgi:hypothetical protein